MCPPIPLFFYIINNYLTLIRLCGTKCIKHSCSTFIPTTAQHHNVTKVFSNEAQLPFSDIQTIFQTNKIHTILTVALKKDSYIYLHLIPPPVARCTCVMKTGFARGRTQDFINSCFLYILYITSSSLLFAWYLYIDIVDNKLLFFVLSWLCFVLK